MHENSFYNRSARLSLERNTPKLKKVWLKSIAPSAENPGGILRKMP